MEDREGGFENILEDCLWSAGLVILLNEKFKMCVFESTFAVPLLKVTTVSFCVYYNFTSIETRQRQTRGLDHYIPFKATKIGTYCHVPKAVLFRVESIFTISN